MKFHEQTCDRCMNHSTTLIMSMFNEDMICPSCKTKEVNHPDYNRARDIELEHVKNKDYNFKGVGKPADL